MTYDLRMAVLFGVMAVRGQHADFHDHDDDGCLEAADCLESFARSLEQSDDPPL